MTFLPVAGIGEGPVRRPIVAAHIVIVRALHAPSAPMKSEGASPATRDQSRDDPVPDPGTDEPTEPGWLAADLVFGDLRDDDALPGDQRSGPAAIPGPASFAVAPGPGWWIPARVMTRPASPIPPSRRVSLGRRSAAVAGSRRRSPRAC
jgi:hypothetical protein